MLVCDRSCTEDFLARERGIVVRGGDAARLVVVTGGRDLFLFLVCTRSCAVFEARGYTGGSVGPRVKSSEPCSAASLTVRRTGCLYCYAYHMEYDLISHAVLPCYLMIKVCASISCEVVCCQGPPALHLISSCYRVWPPEIVSLWRRVKNKSWVV